MNHFVTCMGGVALMATVDYGVAARSEAAPLGAREAVSDARALERSTLVLPYAAFGPQAAAYELIGYEWYQWNNSGCGCTDPAKADVVKVVVYRGISLRAVQSLYPVIEGKSDYRHIEYGRAMRFLRDHMDEWEEVAEQEEQDEPKESSPSMWRRLIVLYKDTERRIIEQLGE